MSQETSEQSRELFRLVVENVEDFAVFATDLEGNIISWNPGVERLLGYEESEWVGRHASIIFTGEPEPEWVVCEREMRTALAEGRAEDRRWHRRKDGSWFWANGLLMLLRDGAGEPRGFAKILRDETERRLAREELEKAHLELERRVEERTAELQETSGLLLAEVKERRAADAQIRELLRRVIDTQEVERKRMARDLHDNLGQQLTALQLNLEALKEACGAQAGLCEKVTQAQGLVSRLDAKVDFIAWELRPAALDEVGLPAALDNFVREWSEHYGVEAECSAAGLDTGRLAPEVEINLYRIVQEALNNIYKHAGASRVRVVVERRGGLVVLLIEDDGKGFDPGVAVDGEQGMGLLSMRERAAQVGGTLEIESTPGGGTTVYVRVPAAEAAPPAPAPPA